ncbi:MAG: hypothetical protein ABI986_04135, partial [Chloroflexota bacterium]
YNDRPPLKSIDVTIDTSQSRQLIEQLQKFADKSGFEVQIAYYDQHGNDFSVWMKRNDVEVITRSPFERGKFIIGFYNNDCIHPTAVSDIHVLVNDLKSLVSEIPNVAIYEEK